MDPQGPKVGIPDGEVWGVLGERSVSGRIVLCRSTERGGCEVFMEGVAVGLVLPPCHTGQVGVGFLWRREPGTILFHEVV